jgi:hypothetical protein
VLLFAAAWSLRVPLTDALFWWSCWFEELVLFGGVDMVI